MIGIDKTTLTNLTVEKIDMDKLLQNNNITLFVEGAVTPVPTVTGEMQNIAYLKIKGDKMFNQLRFGIKISKGTRLTYCFLSLANNTNRNNLRPIIIDEYRNLLEKVKDHIRNKYGVFLNLSSAKFKEIEINMTMEIQEQFVDWKYLIKLMRSLAPKKYFAEEEHARFKNFTGIVLGNDSVRIKIYDKTKQLRDVYNINLNKNYLRIEYKLLNTNKINQVFATSFVKEITDEKIKNYLIEQIKKDMVIPLQRHVRKGNKLLLQLAKSKKEENKRNWIKPFLDNAKSFEDNNIPLLMDTKQLEIIIKKLTGHNATTILKKQQNTLNNLLNKYSNFAKINDIMEQFT